MFYFFGLEVLFVKYV